MTLTPAGEAPRRPLTIVTFIWRGERDYGPEHANALKAMLDRHMLTRFRLVVIADEPSPLYDPSIEFMLMPTEARMLADIPSPEGGRFPSSYRRLWLFSAMARQLGSEIILTDVDVVVTGDWSHLAEWRGTEFVGWKPRMRWGGEHRLAGGMWYLRTGARTEVWDEFVKDPHAAIAKARAAGFRGSDQAWISYMLTDSAATWPASAGIYSVRDFTRSPEEVVPDIPADACVVHFNGNVKPWMPEARVRHPWIDRFWPSAVDASGRAALG